MNPDKTRQIRNNNGWGDKPPAQAKHLTGECTWSMSDVCPDCHGPTENPSRRCNKCHKEVQKKLKERCP